MPLNKDQLRKLYKIPKPTGECDPSVLARRKYHEASALLCDKWLSSFHACFFLIGLVFILTPAISESFRLLINQIPIFSTLFYNYSNPSGFMVNHAYLIFASIVVRNVFSSNLPGNKVSPRTYAMVVAMDLYPQSKKEEISYFINMLFVIGMASAWLLFPSGVLAVLILPGE